MLGYALGVDLGGTNLRVGAVDEHGRLLENICTPHARLGNPQSAIDHRPLPAGSPDAVIDRMCADLLYLRQKFTGSYALRGIGVSIPGIIDLASGTLRESPNLPGWSGYPAREEIERRLGTRVILENDANAAAVGECWLGAARDYNSCGMITLGTGVGGAIIVNGALCHGANGMAGEPGHVTVFPDGPPCACGNRGCLEQYAGARAIVRMAREAATSQAGALADLMTSNPEFTSREVYDLAAAGDEPSRRIFALAGRALGIAIAGMINLLNLPIYIVGGGGSGAWELFSPHILDEVRQRSFIYRATMQSTHICRATLGPDAGIYGAARLPMLPAEAGVHGAFEAG